MLKQTDLQGRLRLLRYGLLVVVVVTFAVSLSFPVVMRVPNAIGSFLVTALIYTAVVAVICVGIYFGYDYVLHRTMAPGSGSETKEKS
jgi:hypothetical protein